MKKLCSLIIGCLTLSLFTATSVYASETTSSTNSYYEYQEFKPMTSENLFNQIKDEVSKITSENLNNKINDGVSNSNKSSKNKALTTADVIDETKYLDGYELEKYHKFDNIDDLTKEEKIIFAKMMKHRYTEAVTIANNTKAKLELNDNRKNTKAKLVSSSTYVTDMEIASIYLDNIPVAQALYEDFQFSSQYSVAGAVVMRDDQFIDYVRTGGPWDLKQVLGLNNYYRLLNQRKTGEYIGNHHFGFMGHHAGYSLNYLKIGAGLYQIYSGTSEWSYISSYFDDPRDSAAIQQGYKDWKIDMGQGVFW